jgi:hypothetical protein
MKALLIFTFLTLSALGLFSQNLVSSNDPQLEVYFRKADGNAAVMTCDRFVIAYNQLRMTGEMAISALATDDPELQALLQTAMADRISFTAQIPEGQFVFHNTLNNAFSMETELTIGDRLSRIVVNGEVSNMKTTVGNTFLIIYNGLKLSLKDDLGIIQDLGLDDTFDFRVTQSVRVINY